MMVADAGTSRPVEIVYTVDRASDTLTIFFFPLPSADEVCRESFLNEGQWVRGAFDAAGLLHGMTVVDASTHLACDLDADPGADANAGLSVTSPTGPVPTCSACAWSNPTAITSPSPRRPQTTASSLTSTPTGACCRWTFSTPRPRPAGNKFVPALGTRKKRQGDFTGQGRHGAGLSFFFLFFHFVMECTDRAKLTLLLIVAVLHVFFFFFPKPSGRGLAATFFPLSSLVASRPRAGLVFVFSRTTEADAPTGDWPPKEEKKDGIA